MPSNKVLETAKVLQQPKYDFVRGPHEAGFLATQLAEMAKNCTLLGIDTETTGLCPITDRVRLIQVATKDYALIVDLNGWRKNEERIVDWSVKGLQQLKQLLESPMTKVLQNAAFDLNFLRGEDVFIGGVIFDTMIAAKIINNGRGAKNDLGSIVKRVLDFDMPKELQKANWSDLITDDMLVYAARDAICLPRLATELSELLKRSKIKDNFTLLDLFKIEMQVLRPIATMQWHGFGFDNEAALGLRDALVARSEELKQAFLQSLDDHIRVRFPEDESQWLPRENGKFNTREKTVGSVRLGTKQYAGFNPRSNKQMAAKFQAAGILLPPNEKGLPSLDQNLLAFIRKEYALVDAYMTWSTSATAVSDIEKLLKSVKPDGRIHCNYRQMGTETGRLSAAEPNLQQVNRSAEFRSKFVASPGYLLLVADFSQIELRVAAELSGEERMLEAYAAGRDLHTETAALMTGVPLDQVTKAARTSAKVANFGLLYGAGPATLRKQAVAQYGIDMSIKEAKHIVEGFRSAYPTLYQWQMKEGNKKTEAVFTALGRRRFLFGFNDKYTTRINTQVQGTAGDIAKLSIAALWNYISKAPVNEAKLIAMVHDEIVLEVKEDVVDKWSVILKDSMERAGAQICTKVPIVAEVSHGRTWADAK